MEEFLEHLRNDHHSFDKGKLIDHVGHDPHPLFEKWLKEAFESDENEPNAMVLATVDEENMPGTRILYLKEMTEEGFVFYTNYKSQKGQNVLQHPQASLLFFWPTLERQIRIEGVVGKVSEETSDAYFASRPKASQLGAWASHQSEPLESREELERRFMQLAQQYPEIVPRPAHWGGYVLRAQRFEFWQGRPSRLHDRIVFKKQNNSWEIFRLNP